MERDIACDRICDDITTALLASRRPTKAATFAAAAATRAIADALHHASGDPGDERWPEAFGALEQFLDLVAAAPAYRQSAAARELRAFIAENATPASRVPAVAA